MQTSEGSLASSLRFSALDVAAASRLGAGPRLREENQDNLLLIDATGRATFLREQAPHSVMVFIGIQLPEEEIRAAFAGLKR